MKAEDSNWTIMIGVPFNFARSIGHETKVISFVVLLYMDDHIEVSSVPENPADEILHEESLRTFKEVPYYEPLGSCPTDADDVEEYGCTIWCRGGLAQGSYALPV